MIDYEAQFMDIDEDTWVNMGAWPNCRVYADPRKAFESARRTENRGIDVAFAKFCGSYYVWTR